MNLLLLLVVCSAPAFTSGIVSDLFPTRVEQMHIAENAIFTSKPFGLLCRWAQYLLQKMCSWLNRKSFHQQEALNLPQMPKISSRFISVSLPSSLACALFSTWKVTPLYRGQSQSMTMLEFLCLFKSSAAWPTNWSRL